ncbi:MAG: hypothetical protein WCL48_10620 [Betaproteobacteria bacterium]
MLIERGSWTLLFGLDWRMLWGKEELASVKKTHPRQCHVVCKVGEQTWLGLHEDVKQKGVYPAALLLGLLKPNCIFSVALGSELNWFCVLQNGMPLAGLDQVVDRSLAHSQMEKYSTLFPTYDIVHTKRWEDQDLDALLERVVQETSTLKVDVQSVRALLVKSPQQGLQLRIQLWCAFVLLLGLLAMAYEHVGEQLDVKTHAQVAVERALRAAHLREEVLKTKTEQEQATQALALEAQRELEKYLYFEDPIALWNAFNAIRHAIPISLNGIHATALRCEIHGCVIEWALRGDLKSALASAATSAHQHPLGLPFEMDRELNAQGQSLSTLALQLPRATYRFPELRTPEQLELYMTLDLKKRWPHLLTTPLKAGALGSQLKGAAASKPPKTAAQVDQTLVHQGTWQMSLTGDAALMDAQRFLLDVREQPVQLQALAYTYQQGLSLKGRYYFLPTTSDPAADRLGWKALHQGNPP